MTFKLNVGLNYPGKKGEHLRAEAGALVSDLPTESIPWLVEQKLIEPVEAPKPEPVVTAKE